MRICSIPICCKCLNFLAFLRCFSVFSIVRCPIRNGCKAAPFFFWGCRAGTALWHLADAFSLFCFYLVLDTSHFFFYFWTSAAECLSLSHFSPLPLVPMFFFVNVAVVVAVVSLPPPLSRTHHPWMGVFDGALTLPSSSSFPLQCCQLQCHTTAFATRA